MSDDGWTRYWRDRSRRGCVPHGTTAVTRPLEQAWRTFAATLPPGARVLDVAAGDGAVARAMAERHDLTITGIDRAGSATGSAGATVMGGVDCASLPFEDASFDAVASQFGIEYCPPAALEECARVLRPGGRIQWLIHDAGSMIVRHNLARRRAAVAIVGAGLFDSARRIAGGRSEDADTARRIAVARRDHAAQSIVDELPAALGQALRGPGAMAGVAAIEAALNDELARLDALERAAMHRQDVTALCARAGAAGLRLSASRLAGGGAPLAWRVIGTTA